MNKNLFEILFWSLLIFGIGVSENAMGRLGVPFQAEDWHNKAEGSISSSLPVARQYANYALMESRKNEDAEGIARAYRLLGLTLYFDGLFEQAGTYYSLSEDYFRQSRNDTALAYVLLEQGRLAIDQYNYSRGYSFITEADALFRKYRDVKGISEAAYELGVFYEIIRALDKAKESYQEAYDIISLLGDSVSMCKVKLSQNRINLYYAGIGEEKTPMTNLLGPWSNRKLNITCSMQCEAEIHLLNHEYDLAAQSYMKSIVLFEGRGENRIVAMLYLCVSEIYEIQSLFPEAYHFKEKALASSRKYGSRLMELICLEQMGKHLILKKDYQLAEKAFLHSLKIAKSINNIVYQRAIYHDLYELRKVRKDFSGALKYLEHAEILKDSLQLVATEQLFEARELQDEISQREDHIRRLEDENKIQALQLNQTQLIVYGMGILLLLAVLIGWLIIRHQQLQAKHRTADLEQKMLRSQLNPHFIFNSLIAIQSFMMKHDMAQATRYLSGFAKLIRSLLINSRRESVSVESEIETLSHYLVLQKLRYDNKFDYAIHVAPKLNTELINVPPNLIHPFVEYSIEYGLTTREDGGRIDIRYYEKDEAMCIEIEDNGSYMGNAKQNFSYNKQSTLDLAADITRSRINLLNKKLNIKIRLEQVCLRDDQGNETGNRIRITIPSTYR